MAVEYMVPCEGDNEAQQVILNQVGKTARLVCPIRYQVDNGLKVLKIRDDGISATQRWPSAEKPKPWVEGTFDLNSCSAKVALEGMGIEVSFVIPDKKTSITIEYISEFPYSASGTNHRKLQLMISPRIEARTTWEDMLKSVGLPLAPGLDG